LRDLENRGFFLRFTFKEKTLTKLKRPYLPADPDREIQYLLQPSGQGTRKPSETGYSQTAKPTLQSHPEKEKEGYK
jgi:hypothetical protein